ncbi:hypothetical protein ACFQZE_07135 [Paenibacillus sp. GCM10027627]|uniref:hypothetical protein n=1 Tax=unclassified Paenibacillus TaxID=185978 RepID=UPI0036458FB6
MINQQQKHYVTIAIGSIKAAEVLKKQIEERFPLLEGNIKISSEAEITSLDKVIEIIENSDKPSAN